ncbi:hypothetical protein MNB_SV-13-1123 [hydrothermal vent metagenome]|uniref:Transglutaminase-like domain-containing protein n=1 Tax=hydrothermal vent metagenome TaxID=652676 RepID=A0A1W1CL25_9ZZZZ
MSACSVKLPLQDSSHSLSQKLFSLDENISKAQSQYLASEIYKKTHALSQEFKLTSPPAYHNFLVTIGARKKGLCYDWSDALYTHLKKQNHSAFSFHLMGANIGEYWSEHNVLLVVAKGKSLEKGIIIDAWRDSGKLYFSTIKEDKKYQWRHRPKRCQALDKVYIGK